MSKLFLTLTILSCLFSPVWFCYNYINDGIRLNNQLTGYWEMADRSATIEKKSEYLDKYVNAVEKLGLTEGHSAFVFKSFSNKMENNYLALKSLQQRLHEIKSLDVKSFAYQTAISQLTEQEWAQAGEMTSNFTYKWEQVHSFWFRCLVGGLITMDTLFFVTIMCFVFYMMAEDKC